MSLKNKINEDLKTALKARDEIKVSTLRLLNAGLKNKEIEDKTALNDEKVIEIIIRESKKRKEAIKAYRQAGRSELAEKEEKELRILEGYLPEQLSSDKIKEAINEIIKQTGASSQSDFGKVMGLAMSKLKGRADGAEVQTFVKEMLV